MSGSLFIETQCKSLFGIYTTTKTRKPCCRRENHAMPL